MMIHDVGGVKNPEAGVIPTSPATAPETAPSTVGFPLKIAVGLLAVGIGLSAFSWFTSRISQEIWEDLSQLITAFQ